MKISLLTLNSFFALEAVARTFSVGKGGLNNFAKLTGKHLCQSLICNKVAGLRPATLFKKRLRQFCEFCETFKCTFFTEHLRATAS